jgi:hypothetical protein
MRMPITPRRGAGLTFGVAACLTAFAFAQAPQTLPPQGGPPGGTPRRSPGEIVRSTAAVPPEIAGRFEEPIAFQQARSGQYFVLDRRGQAVYGINRELMAGWVILRIGQEQGRVYEPSALAVRADGTFVVADRSTSGTRIQVFTAGGFFFRAFTLPSRDPVRLVLGGVTIRGIGTLQVAGEKLLVTQPENGALFSEYTLAGLPARSFGNLRATGHEADRDLHFALNAGIPLIDPTGGYYFVFQTGVPLFRKYDRSGRVLFERHIEGRELDETIAQLPGAWPRRSAEGGREFPLTTPVVRTAAVDPAGNLWVSLMQPYTYVYDGNGDRRRVVQFRGAGIVTPTSLFFADADRMLVTPGCYEFNARPPASAAAVVAAR